MQPGSPVWRIQNQHFVNSSKKIAFSRRKQKVAIPGKLLHQMDGGKVDANSRNGAIKGLQKKHFN